ncbi:MAG: M50 family metallopeptidase [Ignavibacteriales bacterium]
MPMKLSPKGKKVIEVISLAAVVVAAFIYWDSVAVFPVKLLTVLLHESSHALMTLVTGGSIMEMQVNYQLGGCCVSKGGNPLFIAPAGYIGSSLLGALLFASERKFKYSKIVCTVFAVAFVLLAFMYIKSIFGILFTLAFALLFFFSPRLLPQMVHSFLIRTLGMISCLYAVVDIKEDLLTAENHQTDAQVLAALTHVPAIWWGILWFAISIIVVYLLVRRDLR